MRAPLLLPVPRAVRMERGCFLITDATRLCLMPGCGDAEEEAARELADAIRAYAECNVFAEPVSDNEIPPHAIGLRLVSEKHVVPSRNLIPKKVPEEAGSHRGMIDPALLMGIRDAVQQEARTSLRDTVADTGLVGEDEIFNALARETGMERVSLRTLNVTPELLGVVDARVARAYRVFPVRVTEETVHVALADPLNLDVMDDLERILGKKVVGVIASEDEIFRAIAQHYGPPESFDVGKKKEIKDALKQFIEEAEQYEKKEAVDMLSATALRSDQAYSLRIEPQRIEIAAASSAGLFYGVQTLIQLVRQYGSRLPALRIEDQPDFRWRGFMLDVSRGRVPTLQTLKWLVHTLSQFKINMLQLYVEHTFRFPSHPEIGQGCSPLEPDELLELDRYCRTRHVELVPSLQSFGHMGRVLSLPKFRHLAEVVQFKDWKRASWRKRQHGMTITPVDEGTYALLAELYADYLPCFSSRWFNVNSDETWDLGKGRSAQAAAKVGVGRVYLHHIERLAKLANEHGRRPMIWSDIIYQHPELIPEVPDDVIMLDWGYAHDSPFARCEALAQSRRPFFVCPGTSGWNQVFNDVWNASLNIRRFAAAGKMYGAIGVLNTDWGDGGHFNMPGCSLHGAVLGAAMSWNEGRPDDETFDRAFSLQAFDDRKGGIGRIIRRAGSLMREKTGRDIRTWELWASRISKREAGRAIPPQAVAPMAETLYELIEQTALLPRCVRERDSVSWLEIGLGVAVLDSLVERAQLDHEALGLSRTRKKERITRVMWAQQAATHARWFQNNWKMRSKPSNVGDILRVFETHIEGIGQKPKVKRMK